MEPMPAVSQPVLQLEGELGTIRIHPPTQEPTTYEEERLYRAIIECIVVKTKPPLTKSAGT